ncbi:MAG: metallophosphoesterase, partial [Pseudomonadota bacterium]
TLPSTEMTLLHMSDLHIDVFHDFADVILEKVSGLKYDAVVLTGDYRFDTAGDNGPALQGMLKLAEGLTAPIFAVLGNHDSLSMVPDLESYGIRVLINESVELVPGIHLSGIDDPHYFRCHDIHKATAQVPDGALTVLLAHSPEVYEEAAQSGVDLLLCGHTHGGQIRLPGGFPLTINADCPRKYGSGLWQFANMVGYTSKGTGSSLLDVRFNCAPEVALHHVRVNG